MAVLAGLEVILYGNQLANVFSFVDLTKTALTNQLQFLYVLLSDEEFQAAVLLQELVELAYLCGLM